MPPPSDTLTSRPHDADAQQPSLDLADAAYAALFAAGAVWSWVGIVLAEAGRFHASWLLALAVPASVVAVICVWRATRATALRRSSAAAIVALVAVAASAAALSARPGEFLVDGADGSVYLSIGRSLVRHHALVHPEPLLDLMPPSDWDAVFLRERFPPHVLNLFPGGIQVYPGINAVQPNFLHLFPVWLAMADVVVGPLAPYFVSPLFSVIAVVAFWLLARALTTPLVATLAAMLLLGNLAQAWFARVPTTEIMAQAFTLSGVYFALLCYRRPGITHGVLAATAFGLACFVRIDVLLFSLPAVVCFLAVIALERRWAWPWTWCALTLAGLVAHAVAHALLVSTPYTDRLLYFAFLGPRVTTRQPPAAATGAGGGRDCIRVVAAHIRIGRGQPAVAARVRRDPGRCGVSHLAASDRRLPDDADEPARHRAWRWLARSSGSPTIDPPPRCSSSGCC